MRPPLVEVADSVGDVVKPGAPEPITSVPCPGAVSPRLMVPGVSRIRSAGLRLLSGNSRIVFA